MKITVYSKPRCTECAKVKNWLTDHEIDFTEDEIDDDIRTMGFKLNMLTAPIVVVDYEDGSAFIHAGFNERLLFGIQGVLLPEEDETFNY